MSGPKGDEGKLVSALANCMMSLGMRPPVYPRPKWYQFSLKRKLAYYDRMQWPYRLKDKK